MTMQPGEYTAIKKADLAAMETRIKQYERVLIYVRAHLDTINRASTEEAVIQMASEAFGLCHDAITQIPREVTNGQPV